VDETLERLAADIVQVLEAADEFAFRARAIVDGEFDQHAVCVFGRDVMAAEHDRQDVLEIALERRAHRMHLILEGTLGQDREKVGDQTKERDSISDGRQSEIGEHDRILLAPS
jgi:hypothetical protein